MYTCNEMQQFKDGSKIFKKKNEKSKTYSLGRLQNGSHPNGLLKKQVIGMHFGENGNVGSVGKWKEKNRWREKNSFVFGFK